MNNTDYQSILKDEMLSFAELRKIQGYDYIGLTYALLRLDSFLIENNLSEKAISKEICDLWCKRRNCEKESTYSGRIWTMRIFCRYLNSIGIPAVAPPKNITSKRPKYDAHIYTDDELRRFFKAADTVRANARLSPYLDKTLPLFYRILYTSGLRLSELRLARIKDFDLENGYITVNESKNHKSRIVPIHPELVKRCIDLKTDIHQTSSDDEYFFMVRQGEPMKASTMYKCFRHLLEKAGIPHTGHGPRIHDFRHTYAVNLLRKWVEEGKDLTAYLPYMRTMLGHETFNETAYYLKLTSQMFPYIKDQMQITFPELIQEVQFESREFY